MIITFEPKDILQIDDARIIYRNFSGEGSKYNREGDRNFAVLIDDPYMAEELKSRGWNVTIKQPRDEDEQPFMYLKVKMKFNDRGPAVYLKSGKNTHKLDESTVHRLDKIDILTTDLDIRPYDWDVNGKQGRTAYLQAIWVTQKVDRFGERYAEEECPEELPF